LEVPCSFLLERGFGFLPCRHRGVDDQPVKLAFHGLHRVYFRFSEGRIA